MHKTVILLCLVAALVVPEKGSFGQASAGRETTELNPTDLLLGNLRSLTSIHLKATVACEVVEFCHVVNLIPSRRTITVDFSGLPSEEQRLMFNICAPGPCQLTLRGSFSYDEILVSSSFSN